MAEESRRGQMVKNRKALMFDTRMTRATSKGVSLKEITLLIESLNNQKLPFILSVEPETEGLYRVRLYKIIINSKADDNPELAA